MMDETIKTIIATVEQNRVRFEAFCYALSEEELSRPVPDSTWLVRDFAAHLGTLDTELVRWFDGVAAGGVVDSSVAGGEPFDIDAFNDAQVAERRAWPLERVFAEAQANRVSLIASLSQLAGEQIDKTMHFAADAKRKANDLRLRSFLVGWAEHDRIHAADMLKALPERASDPETAAWVEHPFVRGYQAAMR